MKRIVTIIGARPQFIKAAVVSREIKKHADLKEIIIHTGQHFDINMSDIFFEEMNIPKPDYKLEINSLSHGAMTGRMLEKIEEILIEEKPDWVLVYGDTNTTLAGALAAKKLHIKVAHVEAGLRSFNMRMPEEVNRILTDRISDLLFCPTDTAVRNLAGEGFREKDFSPEADQPLAEGVRGQVIKTGDVMLDAALYYSQFSAQRSNVINRLDLKGKDFVLCTIHRAENTDDPVRLKNIFDALNQISRETSVVLPLHPRTQKIISEGPWSLVSGHWSGSTANDQKLLTNNQGLITIPPVGYFDMLELLKGCSLVMTDSGGLQKEAFFFKKPCITLRDETEWVELVEGGFNSLVGSHTAKIIEAFRSMKEKKLNFNVALYGEGSAAQEILQGLLSLLV